MELGKAELIDRVLRVASHAAVFRGASFVGRDEKRACVGGWGGGGGRLNIIIM